MRRGENEGIGKQTEDDQASEEEQRKPIDNQEKGESKENPKKKIKKQMDEPKD